MRQRIKSLRETLEDRAKYYQGHEIAYECESWAKELERVEAELDRVGDTVDSLINQTASVMAALIEKDRLS